MKIIVEKILQEVTGLPYLQQSDTLSVTMRYDSLVAALVHDSPLTQPLCYDAPKKENII